MDATTIGVDVSKTVFEIAMANRQWRIVQRRRLNRAQFERFLVMQAPVHLVMEACGMSQHWARVAQLHHHEVTLLPAQYVRPYVRRNKTDRTDAEALLEAVRSGAIAPVAIKTAAQQELLAVHRVRQQWMTTRTARINALRGLLREHGIVLARSAAKACTSAMALIHEATSPVPARLRHLVTQLVSEIRTLEERLTAVDRELTAVAKDDAVATRLMTIPGIGVLTATAFVGSVGHIHAFKKARRFASWLGITPRERSSGQRRHLGRISKAGDRYLRCLLAHGARSCLLAARRRELRGAHVAPLQRWALSVQARSGHNKATIALTNKLARIVWAVWTREVAFTATPPREIAA